MEQIKAQIEEVKAKFMAIKKRDRIVIGAVIVLILLVALG